MAEKASESYLRGVVEPKIDIIDSVLGDVTDSFGGTPGTGTLYSLAGYMSYYHVHSPANVYPVLASPVEITASENAWTDYGAYAEVIPVNTITSPFDIHWVFVSEISAAGDYVLEIAGGAALSEEVIGRVAFTRGASALNQTLHVPVQIPPQAANTRISARLSSSNAVDNTAKIKFYYHIYP